MVRECDEVKGIQVLGTEVKSKLVHILGWFKKIQVSKIIMKLKAKVAKLRAL